MSVVESNHYKHDVQNQYWTIAVTGPVYRNFIGINEIAESDTIKYMVAMKSRSN